MNFFYPPQPTRLWPNSSFFQGELNSNPRYDGEIKYNGWRVEVHRHPDSLVIYNRHGTIINIDPRPFMHAFQNVPVGSVFDGELVDRRTKDIKFVMVFWDCMVWDRDIRKLPLIERRPFLAQWQKAPKQLTSGTEKKAKVYRIRHHKRNLVTFYDTVVAKNDPLEEGIVIKDLNSQYEYNAKRSFDTAAWFKIKKIGDHALVEE